MAHKKAPVPVATATTSEQTATGLPALAALGVIRDAAKLPVPAVMTAEEASDYLTDKTISEGITIHRTGETNYQAMWNNHYDQSWDDDYSYGHRIKPSEYDTTIVKNRLREELSGMLGSYETRNVAFKLFVGVRPPSELPGEETKRQFTKVSSKNNLKKTIVGEHMFHSRKDFMAYATAIMGSYDNYEIVRGSNAKYLREIMHLGGYVDRAQLGVVFFAPFPRRNSQRVLCFMGEDQVPTAEFLDAVLRRVPGTPIPANEVPVQVVQNDALEKAIRKQKSALDFKAHQDAVAAFASNREREHYAAITAGIEHEAIEIAKVMAMAA